MRAVAVKHFGSPDGMTTIDVPQPEPGAGQVAIEVAAIGVGGVDAVIRRGTIRGYGITEGHILGSEVAGVVTAVGPGVDEAWIGERVWAFTGRGGGYVEHAIAGIDDLERLPAGLSPEAAVAVGGSGVVAHFGLAHVHFTAGESVLIRGAAGTLGIMTIQLAARAGAAAIAVTTSSPARGERLRALGATHVLTRDGVGDGPGQYDVLVDIAAGPDLPSFFPRLAPNGRIVLIGIVAGPPPDLSAALMQGFQKSLTLATFSADTVAKADQHVVRRRHLEAAARGELDPVIHDILPLDEAAAAHQRMDSGEVFGRIVLRP